MVLLITYFFPLLSLSSELNIGQACRLSSFMLFWRRTWTGFFFFWMNFLERIKITLFAQTKFWEWKAVLVAGQVWLSPTAYQVPVLLPQVQSLQLDLELLCSHRQPTLWEDPFWQTGSVFGVVHLWGMPLHFQKACMKVCGSESLPTQKQMP